MGAKAKLCELKTKRVRGIREYEGMERENNLVKKMFMKQWIEISLCVCVWRKK